jgi:hypothetical protein
MKLYWCEIEYIDKDTRESVHSDITLGGERMSKTDLYAYLHEIVVNADFSKPWVLKCNGEG